MLWGSLAWKRCRWGVGAMRRSAARRDEVDLSAVAEGLAAGVTGGNRRGTS